MTKTFVPVSRLTQAEQRELEQRLQKRQMKEFMTVSFPEGALEEISPPSPSPQIENGLGFLFERGDHRSRKV